MTTKQDEPKQSTVLRCRERAHHNPSITLRRKVSSSETKEKRATNQPTAAMLERWANKEFDTDIDLDQE